MSNVTFSFFPCVSKRGSKNKTTPVYLRVLFKRKKAECRLNLELSDLELKHWHPVFMRVELPNCLVNDYLNNVDFAFKKFISVHSLDLPSMTANQIRDAVLNRDEDTEGCGFTDACCSNNVMGYSGTKKWLSPQQIATMNLSLLSGYRIRWWTDCTVNPSATTTITANETWETVRLFSGDLIVTNNATLTVKCKVGMPENGKVIVDRGAKLIIDGGYFYSSCSTDMNYTLWKGIEVWGNSSSPQYTVGGVQAQGLVSIFNNGLIKNAIVGINAIKTNAYGVKDYNYCGGIVRSNGANFINNLTAINIEPFHNPINITTGFESPYNGYIVNSLFKIEDWPSAGIIAPTPTNYIIVSDVKGLKIQGNTFDLDNSPYYRAIDIRAITSFDAALEVSRWNPIGLPSKVNNFKKMLSGVEVYSTDGGLRKVKIDRNTFENTTHRSTLASAQNNLIFTRNSVSLSSIAEPGLNGMPFGLYLQSSTKFDVQENAFSGSGITNFNMGLMSYYSGNNYNKIYNNSFNTLHYSSVAYGDNRADNGDGLQFKCNNYTGNLKDILVRGDEYDEGIAPSQGAPGISTNHTFPAGNTFSWHGTDFSDYDNSAYNLQYFHHTPTLTVVPADITTNTIQTQNTGISYVDKPTACPNKVTDSPSLGSITGTINVNLVHLRKSQDYVDSLIDKGNTAALLARIDTTTIGGQSALRTYLLSFSPYISDEALLKVTTKLSNTMLVDVYKKNPHAGRNRYLTDTLKTKTLTMPDSLIDKIRAVADSITSRDTLLASYSNYKAIHQDLIYDLINVHLEDSTYNGIDTAIAILREETDLRSQYNLISMYIENDDAATAMDVLDSIPLRYLLKDDDQKIYDDYAYITKLADSLETPNHLYRWFDATIPNVTKLQNIASTNNYFPGAMACNILRYIGEDTCDIYFYVEPSERLAGNANEENISPGKHNTDKANSLLLYPNPATDKITIQYQLDVSVKDAIFELYAMDGKIIFAQPISSNTGRFELDVNALSGGIYYAVIKNNKAVLKAEKLVVNGQ